MPQLAHIAPPLSRQPSIPPAVSTSRVNFTNAPYSAPECFRPSGTSCQLSNRHVDFSGRQNVCRSSNGQESGTENVREEKDVTRSTRGFGSTSKITGGKGFGSKAPRVKKSVAPGSDEQISNILKRVEAVISFPLLSSLNISLTYWDTFQNILNRKFKKS